jgi:hypothetical protein
MPLGVPSALRVSLFARGNERSAGVGPNEPGHAEELSCVTVVSLTLLRKKGSTRASISTYCVIWNQSRTKRCLSGLAYTLREAKR